MKKEVKEIIFDNKMGSNLFFDLVDLEDILSRKPLSHNQFDHHKISFYVLVIITENEGKHSINYNEYSFKKGTVFTLRKNCVHKFYRTNAKGKFLVFTENFVVRDSDKIATLKLFQLFNEMLTSPKLQLDDTNYNTINNIINLISKEYFEKKDRHSVEIIRNLIQVLIHNFYRIKSKENTETFNKNYHLKFLLFQELIENDCFNNRKVSYYANKINVTTRTLNNITQSIIGKHPKAFIDDIAILQIKKLLINSHLSITEIAYQTGFDDPTNFFKYFRKKTGFSPKQFKSSLE